MEPLSLSARRKASIKITCHLGIVVAVLLLAVPACETSDPPGALAPEKPVQHCLEFGSPERGVDIIWPVPGQPLHPGGTVCVAWRIREACGETYASLRVTYHVGGRIAEELEVPEDDPCFQLPKNMSCDYVCVYVAVFDELGPLGDEERLIIGPLPRPQPGPRIPHERAPL